jgi:hypothetical protein
MVGSWPLGSTFLSKPPFFWQPPIACLAFNGKRNGSSENGISRRIGHGSLLFSPNPLIATGWELSWDFRLKRFLSAISRINRVPLGKRLVGIRETNSHSPSYVNSQDPQTNRRLNSLSPPNSHSPVSTPLNQTGCWSPGVFRSYKEESQLLNSGGACNGSQLYHWSNNHGNGCKIVLVDHDWIYYSIW